MWDDKLFMTREQIREYDRIAIEEIGIPGAVLMENAGRAAAVAAARMRGSAGRVAIVAGPGNNGGDGFVIARHLLNRGIPTRLYLAVRKGEIRGDALTHFRVLESMKPEIFDVSTPRRCAGLSPRLREDGFVVDALLGTGVSRKLSGHLARIIEAMNRSGAPILAVDIPSGVDADTGAPWGPAVRATATVTFGHVKRGLLLHPGAALAGELHVVPIGVPGFASQKAGCDGTIVSESAIRPLLRPRAADGHKGTYGHLLVIAGAPGKTGAAAMTGKAAMRAGAGLVTVATTADAEGALESKCLEVMVDRILESGDAPLSDAALRRASRLLEGKQAVALGPGLSTAPGVSALVLRLLPMLKLPVIVDADGLNILAGQPTGSLRISAPIVLTPHPGEMARLLGRTGAEVQADRVGAARLAARLFRGVIVLKGAHTIISAPDGRLFINTNGNPGMASGGMGDALTGMIGGFLAQGKAPLEAALLGVHLHGLAGDRVSAERTPVLASDVIEELPRILAEWADGPRR